MTSIIITVLVSLLISGGVSFAQESNRRFSIITLEAVSVHVASCWGLPVSIKGAGDLFASVRVKINQNET
jgi:hypothetical protein